MGDYPRPLGRSKYPQWIRDRIMFAPTTWSTRKIAQTLGVSHQTVFRVRKAFINRNLQMESAQTSSNYKLSRTSVLALFILVVVYPQVSLEEARVFLAERGDHVSISTICREFLRLGFSRKRMQHYSCRRNEERRVQWWTEPPHRGGCFGVSWENIVDIDESKIQWGDTRRLYGRSLVGIPARRPALVCPTPQFLIRSLLTCTTSHPDLVQA